jgi:hypothetical protein
VEVLPDLGEEVKEGQEEGVEGVEPAVEAAWGGDVGEEVQVFGEGQGLVVGCGPSRLDAHFDVG